MNKQSLEAMYLEDMPKGDVTSEAIFTDQSSVAQLIAKQSGIICGLSFFQAALDTIDPNIELQVNIKEGDFVNKGQIIANVCGKTLSILKAERVALNILQHLSGISTRTNEYVQALEGADIKILDTRKTIPLYREEQKYAVRIGGGENHRFSLSDQAMIKDNHIKAAGSIKQAVDAVRNLNQDIFIITECESLEQVQETLQTTTDVIMLDNMSNEQILEACELINGQKLIEVSGNINLERIAALKKFPIDRISIGELTHSVKAFDISLKF